MKKCILFLSILSLFINNIFSDKVHDYEFVYIKTIPTGKVEGSIGWEGGRSKGGGLPCPFTFTISEDEKVYVPDPINERHNIFDLSMSYISTIIESGETKGYSAVEIRVDNSGRIIELISSRGLKKIDSEGNEIFFIKRDNLPDEVMGGRNYFPLGDYVFFYDDHGYVRSITPTGYIQKPGRSMQILTEMSLQASSVDKEGLSEEKTKLLNTISQDRKHIIVGDKLFSTDKGTVQRYFKNLREKSNSIKGMQSELNGGLDIDISKIRSVHLIGYDVDHNSYWEGTEKAIQNQSTRKRIVWVYSKYGKILDAFYYGDVKNLEAYKTTDSKIATAPNGDVYFMVNDKDGSHFWKVERKW